MDLRTDAKPAGAFSDQLAAAAYELIGRTDAIEAFVLLNVRI